MKDPDNKLRVGILLDSLELPAWQFALLESIQHSECAIIALLIHPQHARPPGSRHRHNIVYKAFKRLEDSKRATGPDACTLTSADGLLKGIDAITLEPTSYVDPASAGSIRERNLDLIVALIEPASLPTDGALARLGLWYFEIGGMAFSPSDGSMIGLNELLWRRPHLLSSLRILGSYPVTAFQTCSAIDYMSHTVTRSEHLWKCSTFVLRALKKVRHMGGEAYLRSLQKPPTSLPSSPALARGHATRTASPLAFLSYFQWRLRRKLDRRFFRERWILLFGPNGQAPDRTKYTRILPPDDRFWADPHVVAKDGGHHVFFEDASQETGVGHISVMSAAHNESFGPPRIVLRRPYHLSYPFVFEWNGAFFMIPESAENRTIELYRCITFPDQWAFEHNLMENISAYDATLVNHQSQWWLFATVRECDGASTWDELCIFSADSPISRDWRPHPDNPVVSDVRCARPAGPFFEDRGRLFRPSQDSSVRYGRALNFNEVLELNHLRYREVAADKWYPNWDRSVRAVHSYSRAGALAFIDAVCKERRPRVVSANR
jgi:hypothetical protein